MIKRPNWACNNYRTYLKMRESRILDTTHFVRIVRITGITCAGI